MKTKRLTCLMTKSLRTCFGEIGLIFVGFWIFFRVRDLISGLTSRKALFHFYNISFFLSFSESHCLTISAHFGVKNNANWCFKICLLLDWLLGGLIHPYLTRRWHKYIFFLLLYISKLINFSMLILYSQHHLTPWADAGPRGSISGHTPHSLRTE